MGKAGVPESVIMQVTGHSTREMLTAITPLTQRTPGELLTSCRVTYKVLTKTLTKQTKIMIMKNRWLHESLMLSKFHGVSDGTRTHAHWGHNPVLCQLSYTHHHQFYLS